MENVSACIESYPAFGIQLEVSMVGGLLCMYAELSLLQVIAADRKGCPGERLSLFYHMVNTWKVL